jgi:hypothetical protein
MSTTGDHQRIPKSPHQPAGWTVSGLVVVVMCVFVGVYGLVGLLQDVVFQCPRSSVRVFGPTSRGFAGNMTGQQLMPKRRSPQVKKTLGKSHVRENTSTSTISRQLSIRSLWTIVVWILLGCTYAEL